MKRMERLHRYGYGRISKQSHDMPLLLVHQHVLNRVNCSSCVRLNIPKRQRACARLLKQTSIHTFIHPSITTSSQFKSDDDSLFSRYISVFPTTDWPVVDRNSSASRTHRFLLYPHHPGPHPPPAARHPSKARPFFFR